MRLVIAAVTLALAGCHTVSAPAWKPETSLLTLCDERGPLLTGTDGKAVLAWGVSMRKEYEICAARHKRLVEAIPKEE